MAHHYRSAILSRCIPYPTIKSCRSIQHILLSELGIRSTVHSGTTTMMPPYVRTSTSPYFASHVIIPTSCDPTLHQMIVRSYIQK